MAADNSCVTGDKKPKKEESVRKQPLPRLVLLLFVIFLQTGKSLAVPTRKTLLRRHFNVTREYNAGDLFSNLDLKCLPNYCSRFGSKTEADLHCSCRCPVNKPIFLQNTQNCTDTIDVCHKVLGFRAENETLKKVPTLFLPLQHQILNPGAQLSWEEAGIELNLKGEAPCAAKVGGILTEHGWIILHKKLFQLHVVNGGTFFKWLGNEDDSRYLQGKLVQIPLECRTKRRRKTEHMCAAFRVMGNDVSVMAKPLALKSRSPTRNGSGSFPTAPSRSENADRNEAGLIVGIVCGALLALTLVGVAIFWVVCWKHQKDRLIRKIQMQFLYQQRFQQQNGGVYHGGPTYGCEQEPMVLSQMHHMNSAQHPNTGEMYQLAGINALASGWVVPTSVARGGALDFEQIRQQQAAQSIDQLPPPPPYPSNVKKKLYFSPEFFEPELMADPPPLAEEFLYEVRRMIDLAKTRLRVRRYMPRIPVIPEEGSVDESSSQSSNPVPLDTGQLESILEQENEDMLEMEEIVGMVSHPCPEDEDEDPERKSPDGSGGSGESPGSGKTGPTSSDASKESAEKDSGIEDSPTEQPLKNLKNSDDSASPGVAQQKVSHWLSKMPEESLGVEESPPPPRKPVRHSKLFKYFTARQSQVYAANAQGFSGNSLTENRDPENPSGDVFRLSVDDEKVAEKTGTNIEMVSPPVGSETSTGSGALLKRYGINGTRPPREFTSSYKDLWLQRSPEYVSRQQILNNHNTSRPSTFPQLSPPSGYGNTAGISVASLPRQFMRHQLQARSGALVFPSDYSLPFVDSFPRINATKPARPEIQPETYSNINSTPPATILPASSQ